MQYIPIKTRIMNPPQDDLFSMLDEYLIDVQEGDVVAISSKVVAISEGNCVPVEGTDKVALVEETADVIIPRDYWYSPLTIVANTFIGTSGIDSSNAGGYYVKLPTYPFTSAEKIHSYLRDRFALKSVGVVITDSHSTPLRRGAIGVSVGFWGFQPTIDCVGRKDLFGREMKVEVANLVDGLSAGATVVMGEVDECQPVVIIRGTPDITFTDDNRKDDVYVPFTEDTFRVLYEKYLKN